MDRKTILIVEDNRDELTIYTTLLGYAGYSVLAAADYNSALDIAVTHVPDLAIVDVNLGPGDRDGTDLVRALRGNPATRDIPVIAHTAFGDVYRDALESAGSDRILHKPSNPTVLLAAVDELLGRDDDADEARDARPPA